MDESAGGEIAWEALYRRLEKPLYNIAYRYVWTAADAQDVVHEAFLALWRRRDLLKAATVDRYLWVATLNAARKRRRWRKLREFVHVDDELPATDASPQARLESSQEQVRLRDAIDALPEKLRTALLLAEFSGLSYDEAAQALRIPAGTFASRRHLALKQLRATLNEGDFLNE